MKLLYSFIILALNPFTLFCQYDTKYYEHSNNGFQYYEEGEYNKGIQSLALIPDFLIRYKDLNVLLNIYGNRDDTTNFKITISRYSKSNYNCENIFKMKNLSKYQHFMKNICHNQFDSIYKVKYKNIKHIITFLDTSIKYSNQFRSEKVYDSIKISLVDKQAFMFLSNCSMKQIASALRYVIQKDFNVYLNLQTTLIHLNYYDRETSIQVENWARELMFYGIIEPKDFAYIVDRRICLIGDSKQKYGEHFWKFNSQELTQINKNRLEIGLIPIK